MSSTTATFLLFVILVFLKCSSSTITTEISALQTFKSKLTDPLSSLTSWSLTSQSPPCDWRGITCSSSSSSSSTTTILHIHLPNLHLSGPISPSFLSNLPNLRTLSLHSNNFSFPLLPSISFPFPPLLRAVYLHSNSFSGLIPPSLFLLPNLRILNLSHNYFSGGIPVNLPVSLKIIDLSFNNLSGDIPANFTSAHELEIINLSFNDFSGQIPASVGELQKLRYLNLDNNGIYGTVPSAIVNCSELVHFSAAQNLISGVVPASLGGLKSLQVVSLPGNDLTGVVSLSLYSTVKVVDLSFNAITGIESSEKSIVVVNSTSSSSVLEVLDVSGNAITGVFPGFLTNFTSLKKLDVSGNLLSGSLPGDIGGLVNLEEFRVGNNSLSGEIPKSLRQCRGLRVVDLSGNRFTGLIPDDDFFDGMKGLSELYLGGNLMNGSIPVSIGNLSSLRVLDLSDNQLSGIVPIELMSSLRNLSTLNLSNNRFSDEMLLVNNIGELRGLEVLNLSGCGFSGVVPSSIRNLLKLTTLDLSKQSLSGELPVELFGLPSLRVVALDGNSFTGNVPEGFSSLSSLEYLNLSSNGFSGGIPATYGFLGSLTVLSLSRNRVSGSIPVELSNCSSLESLELRENELTGEIPSDFSNLSRLKSLDIGQNGLTGEIPESISNCSSLEILLLDSNHISGHIPNTLAKLSNLRELDLSSNDLTGTIPENLSLMPDLQRLNLSANNLEGEIPEGLASRFSDPSVFAMNKNLCGRPLTKNCKNVERRKRRKLIIFIAVAVAGSLLLLLCCCGYIYSLMRWRRKLRGMAGEKKRSPSPGSQGARGSGENGAPKLVMFNNKITYAETLEATRQFDEENVLSRGKYGLLFKATYADGMVLAIRRLPNTSIPENIFRKEAESLGKVKHRNLTVLRGYYAGPPPDMRLVIYDYMPNGNLATLLQEASHQEGHVLNWPMRHLIALGIARGLAFLHSVTIVHGDVKPQNVLFDADFEAHLSDFGLDKVTIATPAEASTSATPVGTLGYIAPEVMLTGEASKEADVYSFGIVVLEILTGKKPVMFTQDEDIVKWVKRQLQRGQVSELLEPGLLELDPESSEWEEFLLGVKVGLLCTMPDPVERPGMTDVVFMLEGCRLGPEIPSSADPTTLPSPT